jgi:hypothetical protein
MDKFGLESINHQVGNALNPNPPEGYDPTLDAMQHQLMREQHDFYTQQQHGGQGQPSPFHRMESGERKLWLIVLLIFGSIGLFHVLFN